MGFFDRVANLPHLGIGVSTEYGAAGAAGALDVHALARTHPQFAAFLELGVEIEKGLDADAIRWLADGRASTWHFLDINLDLPERGGNDGDFDADWLGSVKSIVESARPAWLCGDAGLWHFGRRDRNHMLLLPPILVDESASDLARGVARLREATGHEVLPENPPGMAFVGDLHILEFFRRVCERADSGMLLDVAHLAMFQHATGRDLMDGVDFCWDRVVEVHVAGGSRRIVDGLVVIDDSHDATVSDDVWALFEHVVARAPNLKAVVFECERNRNDAVIAGFERIARTWPAAAKPMSGADSSRST